MALNIIVSIWNMSGEGSGDNGWPQKGEILSLYYVNEETSSAYELL